MVNCKGVKSSPTSPTSREICHFCRIQFCDECYSATSKIARHQHACLPCIRQLQHHVMSFEESSPKHRRSRMSRFHLPNSGRPRIESLSVMTREHRECIRRDQPRPKFLSVGSKLQEVEVFRRGPIENHKLFEHESSPVAPFRRHTSILPSASQVGDSSSAFKTSRSRPSMKTNATEQEARNNGSVTNVQIPTTSTTSLPKDLVQTIGLNTLCTPSSKMHRLSVPKPTFNLLEESDMQKLSLADSNVLKQKDRTNTFKKRKGPVADKVLNSVLDEYFATSNANHTFEKLPMTRTAESLKKESRQSSRVSSGSRNKSVDLSSVKSRQHRHVIRNALKISRSMNQEPKAKVPFQHQKTTDHIDFHLSQFGLKSCRRSTEAEKVTVVMQSKSKPCDLAYLQMYKSSKW
ncbi:uncharacterized protein CCR75_002653 [Bremia lactucae]|uniref:Uncharacterized protein n=1 Tax=Bremia lactucae TaxID=4779 RepID=A0A976FGG5_BRELC|nr:hypothetical protein CCR75_002653 [Bremia lactucae]